MLQRLRHRVQRQEGFTLIELLVVVLIIGILAAVAIPTFLSQKGKAQDSNVQANLNTLQTAESSYNTSNNGWANDDTGLTSLEAIEPSIKQFGSSVSWNSTAPDGAAPKTSGAAINWSASITSPSKVVYDITVFSDGTTAYTCNVPDATVNEGACIPTTGSTGNGVWANSNGS